MEIKEILSHVDHTLLRPDATWDEIKAVCDDGVKYGCASVCIPPCYVKEAVGYLKGKLPVCTVIGFPNGSNTTAVKMLEARDALANGADELDVVLNIGWLKAGAWEDVGSELKMVRGVSRGKILKVIVEACLLTEQEKIHVCRTVVNSGADYIKTSTGFSTGGATREDVALFKAKLGSRLKIKAAGGIATLRDAEDFLNLGADRLGTSRIVQLAKAAEEQGE